MHTKPWDISPPKQLKQSLIFQAKALWEVSYDLQTQFLKNIPVGGTQTTTISFRLSIFCMASSLGCFCSMVCIGAGDISANSLCALTISSLLALTIVSKIRSI